MGADLRGHKGSAGIARIALLLGSALLASCAQSAVPPSNTEPPTAPSLSAQPSPSLSTSSPAATSASAAPSTLAGAVDALADALERSDWNAIAATIGPEGWNAGFHASGGTNDMAPPAAVSWLRARAEGDRLNVVVERRPEPIGDGRNTLQSTWRGFNAYMTTPNRTPVQGVQLILSSQGGRWYWRTGVFGGPAS